jgi:hypothetical protein
MHHLQHPRTHLESGRAQGLVLELAQGLVLELVQVEELVLEGLEQAQLL